MFNCYAFYEEVNTKYGFSDGNAVPPGAEECRNLLVEAFNALAPTDAAEEAYAYDRGGMHNPYLILWRYKGTTGDEEELETPDWAWDALSLLDEHAYLYEMANILIEVAEPAVRAAWLTELSAAR